MKKSVSYKIFVCFLIGIFSFSPNNAINKLSPIPCKHHSTFFTEQKVRNAEENIRKYAWAKKEKDDYVKRADEWLSDYKDNYNTLWQLMPSQMVPRSFAVNSLNGCLVCGTSINRYGNYSYLYDKHHIDWKLTCPNCHLTFPTNNFKAYYEGGLDKNKKFNSERARLYNDMLIKKGGKGNLINLYTINGLTAEQLKDLKSAGVSDSTIHRITTDVKWGVDDGMGYHFNPNDKERYGDPYTYVAYYSHWVLWYWRVMPMLEDLSHAYMFTRFSSDPIEKAKSKAYANAAIILLDRIADLYPEMKVEVFPRNNYYGFPNSGYHWGTKLSAGRIVGSVWENTFIKAVMLAYDAVYPAINTNRIKLNFENGVLREVYKAFIDGDLQSNPGYQSTLAIAAVLIDHYPETTDWLNLTFKNGNCEWETVGKRTGGSVLRYIVDRVSRDGIGDEVSMGYNSGWLPNWSLIAKVLDGYKIPTKGTMKGNVDINLYHNARFEKLFNANYPLLLTDNYVPHIGDTGLTGQPDHSIISIEDLILGYSKYKKTEQAQAIYLLKDKDLSKVHLDIYTKDPEKIQQSIKEQIQKYGELKLTSNNLSAYGLGIMRDGERANGKNSNTQRTLWMFYGTRNASHNHADPLNLGYIGYDLDLTPELGYPNTLGGSLNPEQQWDKSTPAHNTVSFDDLGYMGHIVGYGKPLHFDATEAVQVIQASSNEVENSYVLFAKQYERTAALIRIDDTDSYYVDFFHVNSSRPYSYNFHTAEIDASNTKYSNVSFSEEPPITFNAKTLRNVKEASTSGSSFSIDWNVLDTWNCYGHGAHAKTDIHLKLTVLGQFNHISLGEAIPPTNVENNPLWLPLLSIHEKDSTTFTTLAEPYCKKSKISSVETVAIKEGTKTVSDNDAKAIKVKLNNGRTDYIICSREMNKKYTIDNKFNFSGFFGVYSLDANDRPLLKYINDGTCIGESTTKNRIVGHVTDATNTLSNKNSITIQTDEAVDSSVLSGKYIYVDNSDIKEQPPFLLKYNAVYPIISATRIANNTYSLDLGDTSVIRGWKDENDYSKGYLRDFSIGTQFYIPLSFTNP